MKNSNIATVSFSIKAAALTFVALFGFIIGTCIVLMNKEAFHEIEYQPVALLDSMLNIENIQTDSVLYKCTKDTCKKDTIFNEIQYRRYLLTRLSDSALDKELVANQLFVNNTDFDDSCLIYFSDTQKHTQPILWDYFISYSLLYNRPIAPYHIQKYLVSRATNFPTNIDFFTEYPGFVLWTFLIILQFTAFPVLIIYGWMVIKKFRKQFPELTHTTNRKTLNLNIILSLVITGVFVSVSFWGYFHPNLITNNLFYKKMLVTLLAVGGMTGLIGHACFTGFLLISSIAINVEDDNNPTETEKKLYPRLYNESKSMFSGLLIISSITLSMVVLTTGVLFTSINTMDFVVKITSDLGYSPFAYHYVMLIGGLCSTLLLLFFIPAKLRLMDLQSTIRKFDPEEKLIQKSPDIIKIIQGLFVVGLPIITGIVHYIINIFTNN